MATPVYNNSFINLELLCFIEGIEVPASNVSISYGIAGAPRLSMTIPASAPMRDLPGYTKLAVFFKDFIADPTTGNFEWRLLFDGELTDKQYNESPSGATLTILGVHAAGEMDQMPLMILPVASYLYNMQVLMAGSTTLLSSWGQNTYECKVNDILNNNKGKFSSMADVVYALMKGIIQDSQVTSAVSSYYNDKMGTGAGGTKMLSRFYGISKATAEGNYNFAAAASSPTSTAGAGGTSNGANSKVAAGSVLYVNGNSVVQVATQYIGTPYGSGGGNGSIDCATFALQVYSSFIGSAYNTIVGSSTWCPTQHTNLSTAFPNAAFTNLADAQIGDQLFFNDPTLSNPTDAHTGICAGYDSSGNLTWIQAGSSTGVKQGTVWDSWGGMSFNGGIHTASIL